MHIRYVKWRNFNSYGYNMQTINFDELESQLFLLLGQNGTGKSTIAEIIIFGLYGKIEGKKLSDLPNRINGKKDLVVEIGVTCKKRNIKIERGINPGIFNVYFDDNAEPYDQAGKGNVQEYLENEFFDIPYPVFKNIIILSINDFKSFLTMSPGDKRNIIDRLFGFSLINSMKEEIKNERKAVKTGIQTLEDELGIIMESMASMNNKLDEVKKNENNDTDLLVNEYKTKLLELNEQKKKLKENLTLIKTKTQKIKDKLLTLNENYSDIKAELFRIQSQIKLYKEQSKCPTCHSDLTTDFHIDIKNGLLKDEKRLDLDLKATEKLINDTKATVEKSGTFEIQLDKNISSVEAYIESYKDKLRDLVASKANTETSSIKELISELSEKEKTKTTNKVEKSQEDNFLRIVEELLSDNGVKKLALKTFLPPLNANIDRMVTQMHLNYRIEFNDKFDCIITSLGEKINPKSLSTGQRKKADFIIIIAFIKLLITKYPSLNLLFLDELFSSIDGYGIHEIIKILRDTVKENKINTWVINHSELPIELFDKRAETYFDGGFSKLKIEDIH